MTGSRVTAHKGGQRPLEMGLIRASPQAIRFGPALSVWVSDPSATLSSGKSVGIMNELTPGAQGDSPAGGHRGSRLTPIGGSLVTNTFPETYHQQVLTSTFPREGLEPWN